MKSAERKGVVVTLPLLLVVLDVYPLRRLPDRWRDWLAPAERQVWAEKVPYGLLALVALIVGYSYVVAIWVIYFVLKKAKLVVNEFPAEESV